MTAPAALAVAALLGAPPSVVSIDPPVLAQGGQNDLFGSGFVPNDTQVTIAGVAQDVVFAFPEQVRIQVGFGTPLGESNLVVKTPDGQAKLLVTVLPPPPSIDAVEPFPVVLGELASVHGAGLGTVETVTFGGAPGTITAKTDALLVFVVPFGGDLVGPHPLEVESPSGQASTTVNGAPPKPVVDLLAPNPVRPGDLLEVGGTLLPFSLSVSVGGVFATLLSASDGLAVVEVPASLPPAPVEVTVSVGQEKSDPAGPLFLLEVHPERPLVTAVVPSVVTEGGTAFLVGSHLDGVSWWTEGLEVSDCDSKSCRLALPNAAPGPVVGAAGGPHGTSVFKVQVEAADPESPAIVPEIASVEPSPAFRGEELTVFGTGLHEAKLAWLGGVSQPIVKIEADRLVLAVDPATSLGAERLFVAGQAASNAIEVTVLEPFVLPEPDPVAEPAAPAEPEPAPVEEPAPAPIAAGEPEPEVCSDCEAEAAPGSDGCAGGGASPAWLLSCVLLAWRRRS